MWNEKCLMCRAPLTFRLLKVSAGILACEFTSRLASCSFERRDGRVTHIQRSL